LVCPDLLGSQIKNPHPALPRCARRHPPPPAHHWPLATLLFPARSPPCSLLLVARRHTQTATRYGTGMVVCSVVSSLATADGTPHPGSHAGALHPGMSGCFVAPTTPKGAAGAAAAVGRRRSRRRRAGSWGGDSPSAGAVSRDTTSISPSSSSPRRTPLLSSRKGSARRWGAATRDAGMVVMGKVNFLMSCLECMTIRPH
jgi:hypothetical protein